MKILYATYRENRVVWENSDNDRLRMLRQDPIIGSWYRSANSVTGLRFTIED
jgi:hypothetical protein